EGWKSETDTGNMASVTSHLRFPNEVEKQEDLEIINDDAEITFIYPKKSDTSDETMRATKQLIRREKETYKALPHISPRPKAIKKHHHKGPALRFRAQNQGSKAYAHS